MFQRFTEKARRVVFFARFEASRYGSPSIETEHLLLGLMREDPGLITTFVGHPDFVAWIREDIEERITLREPISTALEMPLAADCKKVLNLACEEADRLNHRSVETGHLLIALLEVKKSTASDVLKARGVKAIEVREKLAKRVEITPGLVTTSGSRIDQRWHEKARLALDSFLAGLKWHKADELIKSFAENAQLIDVLGNVWNRDEIHKDFETLFAPYAKKNAAPHVEKTFEGQRGQFTAIVLWKNAVLASMERIWVHRMTIILVREAEVWRILLMQVTPVQRPPV